MCKVLICALDSTDSDRAVLRLSAALQVNTSLSFCHVRPEVLSPGITDIEVALNRNERFHKKRRAAFIRSVLILARDRAGRGTTSNSALSVLPGDVYRYLLGTLGECWDPMNATASRAAALALFIDTNLVELMVKVRVAASKYPDGKNTKAFVIGERWDGRLKIRSHHKLPIMNRISLL